MAILIDGTFTGNFRLVGIVNNFVEIYVDFVFRYNEPEEQST